MLSRFSKILIVDDSLVVRKVLRGQLGQIGYDNVEEAANGLMAMAMLNQRTFRLVISDWDMAPMDGLELLQTMRRDQRLARIPFIMATALSRKKFSDVARDSGATHYLVKPFTAAALAERIARIGSLEPA